MWCAEQDEMFLKDAKTDVPDLDEYSYKTQFECLSFFVAFAACTQELRPRSSEALWGSFCQSWLKQIENYRDRLGVDGILFINAESASGGLCKGIDDYIFEKIKAYSVRSDEAGISGVAEEFSRLCCGRPNNTLWRIGSSLYQVRGAEIVLSLRRLRLVDSVPSEVAKHA